MKNNLSTGIDIVSINRIKEILTSSKRERFLKKIFSSNEIKEAKSIQNEGRKGKEEGRGREEERGKQ